MSTINVTVKVAQPIQVTVTKTGATGPAGPGLISGGVAGQYLRKNSSTNYDAVWANIAMSEVTGLVSALAAKSDVGHTHQISDVVGLQTTLDGKSNVGHTHSISDVTGLQTALDGKQNLLGYTAANDANVVHKTGDETVAGTKTFSDNIIIDGAVSIGGASLDTSLSVLGDFDVQGSTKSYRFRTSGAALDLDGAGASMYVSVYDNGDFTGTQRTYMIFGQGSDYVTAFRYWEWKNASNDIILSIEPSTNTVNMHSHKITSGAAGTDATDFVIYSQISSLATDSNVVHKTGDETIAGDKTFTDDVIVDGSLSVAGTVMSETGMSVSNSGARSALNRPDATGTVGFDFKTNDVYDWAFGMVDSNSDTLKYSSRLFGDTFTLLTNGNVKLRQKLSISDTDTTPTVSLHVAQDTGTNTVGELARFDARQGGSSGAYATFHAGNSEMGAVGGYWTGSQTVLAFWTGTSHTLAATFNGSQQLDMNSHKIVNGSAATNSTDFVILSQLTAANVGLGNVTNNAQLPLTGGNLTGDTSMEMGTTFYAYNTTDHTTNYERMSFGFASNIGLIQVVSTGAGVSNRTLRLRQTTTSSQNMTIDLTRSAAPYMDVTYTQTNTTTAPLLRFSNGVTHDAASGTQTIMAVTPTFNQSSTAGYSALLVNVTETATGSGTKRLLDLQVGGTSRFNVSNTGAASTIASSGDSLTVDSGSGVNSILRLKQNSTERGAMFGLSGNTDFVVRAQSDLVLTSTNATTPVSLRLGSSSLGFGEGVNIAVGTTTGTMIGTTTSQKLAFFGNTPITKQGATVDLGTVLGNYGLRTGGATYPITTSGAVTLSGTFGVFGATPVSQQATYTVTNSTPSRTLDVSTVTTAQLANVVASIIADRKALGFTA